MSRLDAIYRLPDPAKLDDVLRGTGNEQVRAARKLKGAIQKHWDSLTGEQQGKIQKEVGWSAQGVLDFLKKEDKEDSGLGLLEKRWFRQLLEAIQKLGAADVTIQPGTRTSRKLTGSEEQVLSEIVARIGTIVNDIKQAKHDTCLAHVFGLAHVKSAKDMFDASYLALVELQTQQRVAIDEVAKLVVWKCGGLTSAAKGKEPGSMTLPPSKLAQCNNANIIVVAHEMTHAIPNGAHTGDKFYREHAGFPVAREARKLVTAAYYEEVFARILEGRLPGDVLVAKPVKGSSADKTELPLLKQYQSRANIIVNQAWATAINIYNRLRELAEWGEQHEKPRGIFAKEESFAALFPADIPKYCRHVSQLLGLTMHRRTSMLTEKFNPVTRLDLSLLDNKLSVLGHLQSRIKDTLLLPPDLKVYDATLEDRILRDALVELNSNKAAPGLLSKDVDKDIIVIRSLATLNDAPVWDNLTPNLTKGLPEPMQTYVAQRGQNAVHVI